MVRFRLPQMLRSEAEHLRVSLEVECILKKNRLPLQRPDCFSGLPKSTVRWIQKEDSTVTNQHREYLGVEFCVDGRQKLRLQGLSESINFLTEFLCMNNAIVNSTCGLHIHIDRLGFPDLVPDSIASNYFQLQPLIDSFLTKSRRSNKHCRPVVIYRRGIHAVLRTQLAQYLESINLIRAKSALHLLESLPPESPKYKSAAKELAQMLEYTEAMHTLQSIIDKESVFDPEDSPIAKEWLVFDYGYKQSAVHIHRSLNTIEFRQYMGTLDAEEIFNWTCFCAAMVFASTKKQISFHETRSLLPDLNLHIVSANSPLSKRGIDVVFNEFLEIPELKKYYEQRMSHIASKYPTVWSYL